MLSQDKLWVDESPWCCEISNLWSRAVSLSKPRYGMLQRSVCVGISPLIHCRRPSLPPQSKRYRPRSPRPPTAGRCAQAQTAAANIELLGPTLLDDPPPLLVPLDRRPRHCEARDRHRLAPRRFPSLLALAIPPARRSAEDHRGDPRSDPAHGGREPGLGSPKIHGELQKLGFVVSERSVARHLRRTRRRGEPTLSRRLDVPGDLPSQVLAVRNSVLGAEHLPVNGL